MLYIHIYTYIYNTVYFCDMKKYGEMRLMVYRLLVYCPSGSSNVAWRWVVTEA